MSIDSGWEVQKAIYELLSNDIEVSNAVLGRIYDQPPRHARRPFLTFGKISSDFAGGVDHDFAIHRLVLNVWSDQPGRAELYRVISALRTALETATEPSADVRIVDRHLASLTVESLDREVGAHAELTVRVTTERDEGDNPPT